MTVARRRVAIVGAGFSGAVLAAQLAHGGRSDVVLIERGRRFGPGLAYGTKDALHLLNVRATNMSALADRPDHFVRWLRRRGERTPEAMFAQRRLYGAYLESVLRGALWSGRIKCVRGLAQKCQPSGESWCVTLASGEAIEADVVVLALGNGPAAAPLAFAQSGAPSIDAWDAPAMARISPAADVLFIGTGLTMVDAALMLSAQDRSGVLYAVSRRGLSPQSHTAATATDEFLRLPLRMSHALHAFRREVRAMSERGEPWQHGVDRLRRDTPALWRALPVDAQARFLRHLRPWWDVHRHRVAPEIAARLAALRTSGKLRVLAGEIVAATPSSRGVEVQHRQRGSLVRHRMEVAYVVICTGAELNLSRSPDGLVRQMLAAGLMRAHASGLGVDVDAEGRVIAAAGAILPHLYALGPITQGAFWECTAVPEIRVRAAALAECIGAG